MADLTEIYGAIDNHDYWKIRLLQAIERGESIWSVSRVSDDLLCDFGKWLYSLSSAEKQTEQWQTVQHLHARFHAAAAMVLRLAEQGDKGQALRMVNDAHGEYKETSVHLLHALHEWAKALLEETDLFSGSSGVVNS